MSEFEKPVAAADRSKTPEVKIRRATVSDIPWLCAIERECFSLPWSERAFEDFLALDYTCAYVAVVQDIDSERIVGYGGLYLSYGDGDITNIAVSADYRRHGIGAAIVNALAEAPGVERLLLEVRESNIAARSLYERAGFRVDGKRRGFYQNPREDAILMSLEASQQNNS